MNRQTEKTERKLFRMQSAVDTISTKIDQLKASQGDFELRFEKNQRDFELRAEKMQRDFELRFEKNQHDFELRVEKRL